MEINETEVLICNSGETMPLDPKKIGDGCNLDNKPKIFNSLCTNEINEFDSALINSSENNKVCDDMVYDSNAAKHSS